MANFRLVYPNAADDATLTVSSALTPLPVTYLQSRMRGYIWRSVDATDQWIKGDWAVVTAVESMIFYRHNLSAVATIRLRIWNGAGQTGVLLYDSGVLSLGTALGWGTFAWGLVPWGGTSVFDTWAYRFASLWFRSAAITTARSFRIDISDAANSDGHMEASRLYMGTYFEPTVTVSRPMEVGWSVANKQFRTAGGSLKSERNKTPFRFWKLKLGFLPEAERATVFNLAQRASNTEDMFISVFPEDGTTKERDHAGLVKFVGQLPSLTNIQVDASMFETPLTFEET